MQFLLVGYMFLFIDRPFEVWPWLGDIHFERFYMIFTLIAWAMSPKKRWLPNPQHFAYLGFAAAVVISWVMSRWMESSQPKVEDWFKIVVFYFLLVTTIHDEKGLKRMVLGFLAVMALYLLHSFKEYLAGKHTYRMGISRMIGVDSTLGDPNSFGASIVFALPFVVAVWKSGWGGKWIKLGLTGYTGLSALCILLTGSRSSLIGFIVFAAIVCLGHRKRFLWITLVALAAPVAFVALPESLRTRFETIVNPEAGPENAKTSGEGRLLGLVNGAELLLANPLAGVGPGAWKPATGSEIESHRLYGQLMGELGGLGVVSFLGILAGFAWNAWKTRALKKANPELHTDLIGRVPGAVLFAVFLLLFMGLFGHNLFRFSWLWYGGFLIIARKVLEERTAEAEEMAHAEVIGAKVALPQGWMWHDEHSQPQDAVHDNQIRGEF